MNEDRCLPDKWASRRSWGSQDVTKHVIRRPRVSYITTRAAPVTSYSHTDNQAILTPKTAIITRDTRKEELPESSFVVVQMYLLCQHDKNMSLASQLLTSIIQAKVNQPRRLAYLRLEARPSAIRGLRSMMVASLSCDTIVHQSQVFWC